jgi:hypothetical protein
VVGFTPWPLCSRGKNTLYHFNRRLGGPQSQSGGFGEGKRDKGWTQGDIKKKHCYEAAVGFDLASVICLKT